MAQDRDSLKSPAEIYADEVVRQQLSYWRGLASQVAAAQAAAPVDTVPATTTFLSANMPLVIGGAVALLLVLKKR